MAFLKNQFTTIRRTITKSAEDRVTEMASSIAFYAFFGLFPLVLAVIAIASHLLESAQSQAKVYEFIVEAFPGSSELLQNSIAGVVKARGPMGLAAVLGFLWSASSGFGAVSRAINRALGSPPTRSLIVAKVRYLLMALTISGLLVAYATLTSAIELARLDAEQFAWLGLVAETFPRLQARVTSFVIVFLMFVLLYKEAPTIKMCWQAVWPGALLATLITEIGKIIFMAYLDYVANLEAVFGSLSSIMVLLLWLYVSAIALIVGAEYNAVRAKPS